MYHCRYKAEWRKLQALSHYYRTICWYGKNIIRDLMDQLFPNRPPILTIFIGPGSEAQAVIRLMNDRLSRNRPHAESE